MAQPSNPIIRIAAQDTTLPVAGGTNKIEPVDLLKTVGFDKGNKAFAQNMNYIFDNLADWIAYSQERLDNLESQVEKERVSVGEIIEITGDGTNPSVLKGYGVWERFGEGQVLVGVGGHTDDRSESKTWIDGQSEGEYNHVQTVAEMATHTPSVTLGDYSHTHDRGTMEIEGTLGNTTGGQSTNNPTGAFYSTPSGSAKGNYTNNDNINGTAFRASDNWTGDTSQDTHNHPVSVDSVGSSSPTNNIQPTIAVYRWKRTA